MSTVEAFVLFWMVVILAGLLIGLVVILRSEPGGEDLEP